METTMEEGQSNLLSPSARLDSFPQERRCCNRRTLTILFSILHCCTVISMVAAILNFLAVANYLMMSLMTLLLLLSGFVCGYIAQSTRLVHLQRAETCSACCETRCCSACSELLLGSRTWYWKAVRWITLGLCQGVVLLLAWDEYLKDSVPPEDGDVISRPRKDWNSFHCKAICALCEGLPAITMLTYAWCKFDSPGDPCSFQEPELSIEKSILRILGFILFTSTGFGIVELDFCCSTILATKMQESFCNRLIHLLFRVSEVLSRTVLHVMFVVITSPLSYFWWIPAASNFILSYVVLWWFGGDEKHFLVRLLCSLPCTWVNIFLFVDSTYKREGARRIVFCLDARLVAEILILPFWVCWVVADAHQWDKLEMQILHHYVLFWSMWLSLLVYVVLRLWMECQVIRQINSIDTFTACKRGNLEQLAAAIKQLEAMSQVRETTFSQRTLIDLNLPDVDGNTLLMLAAKHGYSEICEYLMKYGAPAFVSTTQKGKKTFRNWRSKATWREWTALHMAAMYNHKQVIEKLIDTANVKRHYQDLNISFFRDLKNQSPLHIAVAANSLEAAEVLVQRFPKWIGEQDKEGKTAIDLAQSHEMKSLLQNASQEDLATRNRTCSSVDNIIRINPLRISRKRIRFRALGVSSYVAAACGGALGRLCLTETNDASPIDASEFLSQGWIYVNKNNDPCHADDAELGKGGFGRVYRVRHPRGIFAMKEFKPSPTGRAPPEVARECEVGIALNQAPHPCIVQLFGIVLDENLGKYSLFMEYCPSDLHGIINDAVPNKFGREIFRTRRIESMYDGQGRPREPCWKHGEYKEFAYRPPLPALDWLGQIFLGLEFMHAKLNILFRDLKPENVLIDSERCAKLADFGCGRFGVSDTGAYSFGHVPGTQGYAAPEVIYKRPHDSRADLYSFGIVTWFVFTGGYATVRPSPELQRQDPQMQPPDVTDCVFDRFPDFIPMPMQLFPPDQQSQASSLAAQFVWNLLQRNPTYRMEHDGIREHPLLRPLELPRLEDGPEQVTQWLRTRRELLEQVERLSQQQAAAAQ